MLEFSSIFSQAISKAALCEYRLEPGDAVTQFACMHAAAPAGLTPFQIFACGDGAVGLSGEFDIASQSALEWALKRIQPAPDDTKLIFDMSMVGFMDHHALLTFDSYAKACTVPVVARSMPPIVGRVATMLGLEHLAHARTEDLR
jgi:anti-anti-sigma regulatory factor